VVAVVAQIAVGAELVGTTTVVGGRRVWARRRTEFRDADGSVVSWVHIDWVLLDDRGTPTRIPPEFEAIFGTPPATFGLARVDLGEIPAAPARSGFTVRPQELDPMAHVNNAVYADWIDEAVIAAGDPGAVGAIPRAMRLEYALAAEPGATLDGRAWADVSGWSFRLADGAGAEMLRARLEPVAADPAEVRRPS
jgi:acyl-ACP thioesterase